MATLLVET